MRDQKLLFIVQAAAIAAIYVVLLLVFAPISFGEVQIRFAEALTVLPYFTPAAIPGLFVGCLLGNFLGGAILPDIIFGSLTTLVAAFVSYRLRKRKYLVVLPPIIGNALVMPFVLYYGYGTNLPIPFMMLTVAAGEIISCGVIGTVILLALDRYKNTIFRSAAV
ncbi:MAG TPA: QueT transporter family protein [Candidatus Limivivens intestinipullorum]|uniref:QueT transporter family protein n=1 Tax=Candidatus Limivivens intestinipullorum TaxID=2840858 RepID=A0A9D1ERW5_9FIRM|nr:QueT transporter family protein [Candidatus Limivivens intestinipullorum]